MNQEGCLRKSQKVKHLNYVSAGSLAASRNKQVLKNKNKQISGYIPPVQVIKSKEKDHRQKQNSNYIPAGSQVLEQEQQVSLDAVFPAALTVHEQVQQVLPNSTTPTSQETHEQVQQESQLPTTVASQEVHEDSTNLE
ncbi:hypothetical protein HAX54_003642, partial [Datura stramonium]|nr:hypothetical protein [Datura stramonium]